MLNLRKRIKELQDNTVSSEAKGVCKEVLESFVNVPESQIEKAITDKLRTVETADKHVKKFIQVSEKISAVSDLGVAKNLAKLKESQIYAYPALSYGLTKIERNLITAQAPEFMVVDAMIECLKTFIWDATVESCYKELKEKKAALNEDIEVCKSIYNLSNVKGSFMYEGIVAKLQEHFVNPTESSRTSIMEDLKKFSFAPEIKALAESFNRIQKSTKGGVQMVAENGRCTVSPIYSPVLLENANEYFFVKGNFYSKVEGKIVKIDEKASANLPEKFREVCRIISDPNVFIKEGKISFYIKRNKVEILENEKKVEVRFNGSKVTSNDLAKNMVSAGLFRLEESRVAYDVQKIAESFDNIFDLDFGKLIESNFHKGSYVILMKEGNSIYLTKVNESQKSNEFFSGLNATQARNIILEFIGYDIKESLSEYLEKDEIALKEMKEAQLEIIKNIAIIEANLEKVNTALQDAFMASNPEITNLKSMLENEISALRSEHRDLNDRIRAFEAKTTSDAGYETGDNVKLVETGDAATVTSINSSRGTVTVVTAKGKTLEVPNDKITSEEANLAQAEARNASAGETEDKKKV